MSLAEMRDLAIVVLAIESIAIGVVLILLMWQVRRLTILIEEEVKPILESLQETVGTVKGTTSLVSETIVTPAIRIGSFASGLRRALRVIRDPTEKLE